MAIKSVDTNADYYIKAENLIFLVLLETGEIKQQNKFVIASAAWQSHYAIPPR
jgi:hypothetical protein